MSLSVTVGVACSFYPSVVVLEALALTAAIVVGLTAYTFHAIKKGADFSMMGPFWFSGTATAAVCMSGHVQLLVLRIIAYLQQVVLMARLSERCIELVSWHFVGVTRVMAACKCKLQCSMYAQTFHMHAEHASV